MMARKALQEYYGYVPEPLKTNSAGMGALASAAMGRKHPIFTTPDVVLSDARIDVNCRRTTAPALWSVVIHRPRMFSTAGGRVSELVS